MGDCCRLSFWSRSAASRGGRAVHWRRYFRDPLLRFALRRRHQAPISLLALGAAGRRIGTAPTASLLGHAAGVLPEGRQPHLRERPGHRAVPGKGSCAADRLAQRREFLVAVAIGMLSPGPVVITATFVGLPRRRLLGIAGIHGRHLPAVLSLILIVAPILVRHRANQNVQGFVKGAYAAAIGTILGACVLLGKIAIGDWLTVLIAAISLFGPFPLEGEQPAADRGDRRRRPDRLSDPSAGMGDSEIAMRCFEITRWAPMRARCPCSPPPRRRSRPIPGPGRSASFPS